MPDVPSPAPDGSGWVGGPVSGAAAGVVGVVEAGAGDGGGVGASD